VGKITARVKGLRALSEPDGNLLGELQKQRLLEFCDKTSRIKTSFLRLGLFRAVLVANLMAFSRLAFC